MTTREQIIAAARQAGCLHAQRPEGYVVYDHQLIAFYAIAFEAGRVAEREECALICDDHADDPVYCGEAIRARGESK